MLEPHDVGDAHGRWSADSRVAVDQDFAAVFAHGFCEQKKVKIALNYTFNNMKNQEHIWTFCDVQQNLLNLNIRDPSLYHSTLIA